MFCHHYFLSIHFMCSRAILAYRQIDTHTRICLDRLITDYDAILVAVTT